MKLPDYPICAALPQLRRALACEGRAVLAAPPGSGKTTVVPLALLHESWLAGQRIVMLEPRRVAARASAARMPQLLGEAPVRVAVEAASPLGWHQYHGDAGAFVGMNRYGASAPAEVLYEEFGVTLEAVSDAVRSRLAAA